MHLAIMLFNFFFSFHQTTSDIPPQRRFVVLWASYAITAFAMISCAVLGLVIGNRFGPDPGGAFLGIVSFAAAGFFSGLCFALYRNLNANYSTDPSKKRSQMSLFTAIAIPAASWLGLMMGVWFGWGDGNSDTAPLPFVGVVLGALIGAVAGLVYEKVLIPFRAWAKN